VTGDSTIGGTGSQPAPGGEITSGAPASEARDRVGPGGDANSATAQAETKGDVNAPGPDAATPSREDRTAAPKALDESTGAADLPPADVTLTDPGPEAAPVETVATRKGMFGVRGSGDTSGYGGLVRRVQLPYASQPPYGSWFDDAVRELSAGLSDAGHAFADVVESVLVDRGELTLYVRRDALLPVVRRLRDDQELRFEFCSGVSGAHFPGDTGRELHAVYHLLSMTHNRRIRLVVTCPDSDPHIPSIFSVYPTNDWHERETWDFFGIIFDGHPALTRIQMPDDWPGHPQRKDYPLGGIPVEYKGATIAPPDERRSYT